MPRLTRVLPTLLLSTLPVLAAGSLGLGPAAAAGTHGRGLPRVATSRALWSFHDPRIIESSGLVDAGRLLVTANDSGDGPYLYAVAKGTGRTVLTTTYSSDRPTDVEALAPGNGGSVWVGDIGDNTASRSTITVYHVQQRGLPRQVSAPRYTLSYPDGPHNAETLLVSPGTGRLYVVTKGLFHGDVYAAPAHLDARRINVLHEVAEVPGRITDGAFLPDGSHVLLRTYRTMALFTFPGFQDLGTVLLPKERLGEGMAVSRRGNLYLSSEGKFSPVLEVSLPEALARQADDPSTARLGPTPGSTGSPGGPTASPGDPSAAPGHKRVPASASQSSAGEQIDSLIWPALGALAVAVVIWAVLTFALPRSRRRQ